MKKIVIIGPESTGKSTLCKKLADHYKTLAVKEYAREYLNTNGTKYTFEDLLIIAKGQIESEDSAMEQLKKSNLNSGLILCDTDMYVMKVWCEFVFERCHHWILNRIAERKYDMYLLCNVDILWIKDNLREYPDESRRKNLYHHYKDIMVNQNVPWINISGSYEERLQKAITAIDGIAEQTSK